MSKNINNLNVFTFIKDIYQSLKHIDKCFSDFNDTINTRMTKIEDNQQIILDKLSGFEMLINKLNDDNKIGGSLNKNIENELIEKMNKINNNKIINTKVELNPDELTFANILENDYTLSDINISLSSNHTDIYSSSSGSNFYSNINIEHVNSSGDNNDANRDANYDANIYNNGVKETLTHLLF